MARSIKSLSLKLALFGICLAAVPASAQIPLESLPQSADLPAYNWFASTDPKKENNDFFLLQPGQTRRVPLSPGTLERLWSTSLFPDKIDLTLVAAPRRSQKLLSGGKTARGLLENKAYTFFPSLTRDTLEKLEKGAELIATNKASEPTKWYFQATVRPAVETPRRPKPDEVSRRIFKVSLGPGEEKEVESWNSPGEIYEFSVSSSGSAASFSKLRLKASFDGQEAVNAPLLSLAGQVAGSEQIQNAVAEFDGSRILLRWPMPFASAKVSMVNDGEDPVQLDVGARVNLHSTPPSPYRFRAIQQTAKTESGKPVKILGVQGAGALVGLALNITPGANATRRTFAYLEGNELITADGKLYEGTGTEDYFSSAWYYPEKPFFHPFEGMTSKTPSPPSVSAYRLMISDALPFKKNLSFDFEQGNGNNTEDMEWTWTAFWYERPPLSAVTSSFGGGTESATPAGPSTPVAPNDRWKIGVAVGLGVVLGIVSALSRRRRRR